MSAAGDDLDRIMAVMERAFDPHYREAWTRRQVEDALLLGLTHYALIDGAGTIGGGEEPAGFTLSRHIAGEEELLLLAVAPDYRGRGYAKLLLNHLERQSRNRGGRLIFLEMRENNPAEKLYNACGFVRIGLRKGYYRTMSGATIDAITFSKDI